MKLRKIRGHHVRVDILDRESIIVDAGAHRGEFSSDLHKLTGCRCLLIEANPDLAAKLRQLQLGPVINAALTTSDGETVLAVRENLEASSIFPRSNYGPETTVTIRKISLVSVLEELGSDHIDLLKLDIEGAEFELLGQTPSHVLRKIKQITVEFHDFLAGFGDRHLVRQTYSRLRSLGFVYAVMSFRTRGDVLFLNLDHNRLSIVEKVRFRHLARFKSRLFQG